MPQRRSPRGPSDSDPMHHRGTTDRSPKLGGDRRSPRGSQSDPMSQKKLGTRIADLESQLGQAQEELKNLKDQLVSAEAAKKAVQEQLEKKSKKLVTPEPVEIQNQESEIGIEVPDDNQQETDVFEVLVEKVTVEPPVEFSQQVLATELPTVLEPEKMPFDELALKNDEINALNTKLAEKEKELGSFVQENESLKNQLQEKCLEISAFQQKEEETRSSLNEVTKELEASKHNADQIKENLEAVEKGREELETEMKKLRVQTEQWRKAADAAAAILSGGVEMNDRRISERCGSMDKHFGNVFEAHAGGYNGYIGSPGIGDDADDAFGGGKRKGSGIKMFDLWRKKGQK